ncbi:MAG: BtpA/SgcQ family protein [Dehalococcoidia bacterium]|nr:BtpA/SgcQ family protein [Dehalococcoidia bacterium]
MIDALFGVRKAFIGVVHLPPLPGSPRWRGDMKAVLGQARDEAHLLAEGGADGIIVENFGDAPFATGPVGPHTVAAMTLAVQAVMERVALPIGINMLRNDPHSALAVAVATGARFIRANVHYGVMVAEEGLIQGRADETLRYRRALGADEKVKIFADVLVKHAVPLGTTDISQVARETVHRGLADGLIVTGPATGTSADVDDVARVKAAVPDVPVLVGSGIDESNAEAFLALADGAIVGTSLKVDGAIQNPVDPARVKRLARRIKVLP